jgi:tetratricopeptide (TPR) repeat protein
VQHDHEPPHPDPAKPTAAQTTGGGPLESLMAGGKKPEAQPHKGDGKPDLAAQALAAAQAAQGHATSHGPDHGQSAEPTATHAHAAPPPLTTKSAQAKRREWVLRLLLVLNLALIGVTLGLPMRSGAPAKPKDEHGASGTEHGEPTKRKSAFAVTDQTLYLRALELAAESKFDDAIAVLEGYLKANPDLADFEQRLTLQAMATFALRAGRPNDATRFEAAIDRLRVGTQLPQDLLDLAKQAETDGRGGDMRRYYARFLLMQKQVPPSLRERIAEAYLKLGDGYRVEAEHGARTEAERKRAVESGADPAATSPALPGPEKKDEAPPKEHK